MLPEAKGEKLVCHESLRGPGLAVPFSNHGVVDWEPNCWKAILRRTLLLLFRLSYYARERRNVRLRRPLFYVCWKIITQVAAFFPLKLFEQKYKNKQDMKNHLSYPLSLKNKLWQWEPKRYSIKTNSGDLCGEGLPHYTSWTPPPALQPDVFIRRPTPRVPFKLHYGFLLGASLLLEERLGKGERRTNAVYSCKESDLQMFCAGRVCSVGMKGSWGKEERSDSF